MKDSFIPKAFYDICEYRGYKGKLAKHISNYCTADNEIDEALTEAFIGAGDEDSAYHPLAIVGFMQTLMDKSCWNARKLWTAQNQPAVVAGVEPAERTAEIVGASTNTDVVETIDFDYQTLFETHALLLQTMDSDINMDLFYFAPQEIDEQTGEWHPRCQCESFSEAQSEMDTISEKLEEESAITLRSKLNELRKNRTEAKKATKAKTKKAA